MMTMSKIMAKLCKKNREQYRLLGICVFLSVLLVSSFTMMYFSPSIQEFLPSGGDTRKLMWLLLGVVTVGCLIFTLYGGSLFFRKKSREFGVMLALGARKKMLAGQLAKEVAFVVLRYILLGILLAVPVSYLVWKIFQILVINTSQMQYRFGMTGILAGLIFAALLVCSILIMGIRFVRRTDIMDILNASRKTEMVREIGPYTGKLGMVLILAGLLLAMAVPSLTARLFHQGMPAIWQATYLLCVLGLYLVTLSAVGRSKKGKRPEKYYNNIISTNLMRFTARQTTRNMCVIALLVFVMVMAAFWGMLYYFDAMRQGSEALYDYSVHYPAKERQIGFEETEKLAEDHGVSIISYEETDSLELIVRYTGKDMDDQKRYFDVEYEKLASFISASDFARISKTSVALEEGEYQTVTPSGFRETIWVGVDCLNEIEHPVTGECLKPEYKGTVVSDNLAMTGEPFLFLLSDADYERFSEGLTDDFKERHVLFDVGHMAAASDSAGSVSDAAGQEVRGCTCKEGELCPATYDFADAWKRAYIERATELSNHYRLYDAREEELALAAGEEYSYAGEIDMSPDNTQLIGEWKYAPFSKILMKAETMEMVAVFVVLSIYISVIALAAAGIMSYIRSITIAADNRQLFEDLGKLGADDAYKERVIRVQLRKIFAYPAASGCGIVGVFSLFLTWFNDMNLEVFEIKMLLMEAVLMVVVGAVLYGVYRTAYRRTKEIAGIASFHA